MYSCTVVPLYCCTVAVQYLESWKYLTGAKISKALQVLRLQKQKSISNQFQRRITSVFLCTVRLPSHTRYLQKWGNQWGWWKMQVWEKGEWWHAMKCVCFLKTDHSFICTLYHLSWYPSAGFTASLYYHVALVRFLAWPAVYYCQNLQPSTVSVGHGAYLFASCFNQWLFPAGHHSTCGSAIYCWCQVRSHGTCGSAIYCRCQVRSISKHERHSTVLIAAIEILKVCCRKKDALAADVELQV